MNAIKRYRRALDKVLLTRDPHQLEMFMRKHGLFASTDEAVELTMHKTITGSRSLPLEVRKESKAWLDARGFTSLDDGDL